LKRPLLFLVCLAILTLSVSACGGQPAATPKEPAPKPAVPKEVVVGSHGGTYEEAFRKEMIPYFEQTFKTKVVYVPGISGETLAKIMAQKDKPQMDVAQLDDDVHFTAMKEGLLAPFDESKIPNLKYMDPVAIARGPDGKIYGIGRSLNATGLFYNTKVFKEKGWAPPTSWLDLWDSKYKGHVTIHHISNGFGRKFFLMTNKIVGGDENNVDPGFKKVAQLVPSVITIDKFSDTIALIQSGEAWIGTWGLDRIRNLQVTANVPIEWVLPKEGVIGGPAMLCIVKNCPHPEEAHAYVNNMLDKRWMYECYFKLLGATPLNTQVVLTPEEQKLVIYGDDLKKIVPVNLDLMNKYKSAWADRWSREIDSLFGKK